MFIHIACSFNSFLQFSSEKLRVNSLSTQTFIYLFFKLYFTTFNFDLNFFMFFQYIFFLLILTTTRMSSLTYRKVLDMEKECMEKKLTLKTTLPLMMKGINPDYDTEKKVQVRDIRKECTPKNLKRRIETRDEKILRLKHELKEQNVTHKRHVSQLDTQLADHLEENIVLNQQLEAETIKNAEKERQRQNAMKKASKYKMKAARMEQVESKETTQILKDQVAFLENECEKMREEFLASNEISVFEDGKYTNEIRQTYMELMSKGVSSNNCNMIIQTVLKNLTDKTATRLPKRACASDIRNEAAAVAKIQCGISILESENHTLHLDGTKKKFREYNTVNLTTGLGQSLSLGYDEMSGGTADDYLCSTLDVLNEIGELLLPEDASNLQKQSKLAELMSKMRNTMTDRHIVNKAFNSSFKEVRENHLALIKDNLEDLTAEEMEKLAHMNNLFCSVHVIANCGTTAKTALKDFEETCELQNNCTMKGTARTYDFLYALSKALTFGHNYMKAGVALNWKAFLEEENVTNQVMSLKGERINILFLLGGAAYYHKDHLITFLNEKVLQKNKLLTALMDIENKVVLSACRALGIIGQLITDPLFRIISDTEHIFDLNELWEDLLSYLEAYSGDPSPLLDGKAPSCTEAHVKSTNPKHDKLFAACEGDVQRLTEMCLKMICVNMAVLIKRQLQDQLPGGQFHKPHPDILQETGKCPSTNLITERDFAHLDRQLKEKPNISTLAVTGTVMFGNNKTGEWLKSLSKEDRDRHMEKARTQAPKLKKKYGEKKKQVSKKICEKMKKKQDDKEKKVQKKSDVTQMLVAKVSKSGGLWESESDMSKALEDKSDEQQYDFIADQLRLRKNLHVRKGDHKLFHLTHQSKKLDTETLKMQLRKVWQSSEDTVEDEPIEVDPETVLHKVNEKVEAKRQELHKDIPAPAKKPKLHTLIGKKFQHKYDDIDANGNIIGHKWYEGEVVQAFGNENDLNCTYEVRYTNEEDLFEVEVRKEMADKCLVITN